MKHGISPTTKGNQSKARAVMVHVSAPLALEYYATVRDVDSPDYGKFLRHYAPVNKLDELKDHSVRLVKAPIKGVVYKRPGMKIVHVTIAARLQRRKNRDAWARGNSLVHSLFYSSTINGMMPDDCAKFEERKAA